MPAPKYHSEILDGETNEGWRHAEVKMKGRLKGLDESDKQGAVRPVGLSDTHTLRRNWADTAHCCCVLYI